MRNSAAAGLVVLTIALAGEQLSAHRLDEYLQAARVAIDPDRVTVELDLTPGVAVADRVLADIDRDRDGRISSSEAQAYAERVANGLGLDVDGVPLSARITGTRVPDVEAIRRGEGTIRVTVAAVMQPVGGAHHFHFRNTHRGDISVYMANALVPADDRLRITDLERDPDQRTLDVAYLLASKSGLSLLSMPPHDVCNTSASASAWQICGLKESVMFRLLVGSVVGAMLVGAAKWLAAVRAQVNS